MIHLVMLGDSVFDNGSYVNQGEPDVQNQTLEKLRKLDPAAELTFLAEDGAVNKDVMEQQLKYLPEDATHLILSTGGNDVLGLLGFLGLNQGETLGKNLQFLSSLKKSFAREKIARENAGFPKMHLILGHPLYNGRTL